MTAEVVAVGFSDPRAQALVRELTGELSVRYGDAGASPAEPHEFDPPTGTFLLAVDGGAPVGCGGLRALGEGTGEIKRMYVAPPARGRGLSRLILSGLVDHARRAGHSRVLLETGTEQPEALGLYESEGFVPVPAYGHHREDPRSRCYALAL